MHEIFYFLWLADFSDNLRSVSGITFSLGIPFLLFFWGYFVFEAPEKNKKPIWIASFLFLGFLSLSLLFPSSLTLRATAAMVAIDKGLDTEIGQKTQAAILQALEESINKN